LYRSALYFSVPFPPGTGETGECTLGLEIKFSGKEASARSLFYSGASGGFEFTKHGTNFVGFYAKIEYKKAAV
jgi:hypothetical protein